MKANPLAPAGGVAPANWMTGALAGALIGGGALIAAMYGMGLFGKDRKMTKLEKAFVSLVIALGEKLEETEKRRNDLSETLAETDRKLVAETRRAESAEAKVGQAEARVTETIQRADVAEKRVKELEDQLRVLAERPTKRRGGRA